MIEQQACGQARGRQGRMIALMFLCLGVPMICWDAPACSRTNDDPSTAPADPTSTVALKLVAQGMTSPVALAFPDDGSNRLFIVDQVGLIRVLESSGELRDKPFLDIKDRLVKLKGMYDERGLLGLAFHPDYAKNGRFFVHYVGPKDAGDPGNFDSEVRIAEFRVSKDDPNCADPASERVLLDVNEPQANHNGGQVVFGPDGYLYIGMGDGGAANDSGVGHNSATGNGQDKTTLLGKILRIDVNKGEPYAIPPDNPFANDSKARPEIWAFGLRNPWGIAFDRGGERRLFIGDVGQDLFEEVDIIRGGGNYGWRIREGRHCFDPQRPGRPPAECPAVDRDGQPLIEPIIEYPHNDDEGRAVGRSVAGGFIYRGNAIPALVGQYIFGDWSTGFVTGDGTLFAATENADGSWSMRELQVAEQQDGGLGIYLLTFGEDQAGELYVLASESLGPSGKSGKAYKIVPAAG